MHSKPSLLDRDNMLLLSNEKRVLRKQDIDYFEQFGWASKQGKLTRKGVEFRKKLVKILKRAQKGKPFSKRKKEGTFREWHKQHTWQTVEHDNHYITTNQYIIYLGRAYRQFNKAPKRICKENYPVISKFVNESKKMKGAECVPVYVQRPCFARPAVIWFKTKKGKCIALPETDYDLCVDMYGDGNKYYYNADHNLFLVRAEGMTGWKKDIVAIIAESMFGPTVKSILNFKPYGGNCAS